jgi:integrase
MRRGECLGLRWNDVQLDAARLSVRQQLSRQGEKVGFGPVKSTAGRRSIALDSVTVAAIRAHRQAQASERLAFGPAYEDHDLVFAHSDASPQDPDVISQTFERLIRHAGSKASVTQDIYQHVLPGM